MKRFHFIIIFNLFISEVCLAFENDSIDTSNSIIYEKVYLHIDRELFAPGDDIWFKSYLVSGINNKLISGYKNIYVQLISDSGKLITSRLLLSKNGTAMGDFQLPLEIDDGTYTIRAFTKYLENFGEKSLFHKKIGMSGSKNSMEITNDDADLKPVNIDVAFLPEGGTFVLNAINHIAFKAIDEKGKGFR
ncbi:MAG: hypothetical protein IPF54_23620 [Draconibacterium sp.]|nr:hypothetical protein [Draconibacterium sp.]